MKLTVDTLILSDLQAPFLHRHAELFIKEAIQYTKPNRIVFAGDVYDFHGSALQGQEHGSPRIDEELGTAIKTMSRVYAVCKGIETHFIWGNHEDKYLRSLDQRTPKRALKSFKEMMEIPDFVQVYEKHVLTFNGYAIQHGHIDAVGGAKAAVRTAVERRGRSTAMGHVHSNGGCVYQPHDNAMIFGLSTGSLADRKAYAFNYARQYAKAPLGCGVIVNKQFAFFLPLPMDSRGKYLDLGGFLEGIVG